MSETLGLKNVNMLSKEQYDGVAEPTNEELWAVSGLGVGFPSDKSIDLTLGADGASYTAPANGWFAFGKRASATGQFFNVSYISPAYIPYWSDSASGGSGNILGHLVPVVKNQVIAIGYNAGGAITVCRFIYAVGEE